MAIRVYRIAVVGCPRALISPSGVFEGVGKSCLCNRFVRPEAYVENHSSSMSEEEWIDGPVTNGDHFIYWGAANKHLPDGTKARFQIVEQTEFYYSSGYKLASHPSKEDYLSRASAIHFKSSTAGKTAYRYKPSESAPRRVRGPVRNTQLFPNEDFGGNKGMGIYGYLCVFDPTLEGEQMENQLSFLSHLLPLLAKRKRKIVIACVKCDAVDEVKVQFGASVANHALKKAVPFLEVSSRESVNIEEAFFALVGPPKKHKSIKNGKRSLSGYLTYRKVIESRKGDLNRAKDAYRILLQKCVTSFSSTWSEILPSIEKEPAYRAVLSIAGSEGEETVLKMFQLRLIEIKLMEASKLYSFHSTSKKLDKDNSQSYQDYLSDAFKGHPDLGNESLYDYVYSPRSSIVSDISPIEDIPEILTEPSLPSSYRNTPDLQSSHHSLHLSDAFNAATLLADTRPRSTTLQDTSHMQGSDLFSYATLPRTPSRSKSQLVEPNGGLTSSLTYFSEEPPPLPPRAIDVIASGSLRVISQSQSFMEKIPENKTTGKHDTDNRRLSNSMDCLLLSDEAESDIKERRYNELLAEPYLHPVEVKEMMSQAPPLPPPAVSVSPNLKSDQPRHPSMFMSMRVRGKSRPVLPTQSTFDNAQSSPILSRSISFEKRGHKRTRSNPWVLESMASKPPELPPRNIDIPPLVPPRPTPTHMSTSSGGSVFSEKVMSPIESSLEFSNRPPLPPTPRHMASERSPIATMRKLKDANFEDSGSSGPFDELDQTSRKGSTDNIFTETPDSPSTKSSSFARDTFRSPNAKDVFEDDGEDPDDPTNQYARIEDIQKYMYVQMSSAPITLPRDKAGTVPSIHSTASETDSIDLGKKSQTMSKPMTVNGTPKRELPSSTSAPLLPWKRKWKKQRTSPIIHEPLSPSLDPPSTQNMTLPIVSPSHGRKIRPLPPSPTKPLRRQFSNGKSSGSNIYEAIDDLKLPRRQGSKKQEAELKWAPPVEPRLWEKYVEAVTKFFSSPEIKQQWVETLKSVMPDEDADNIIPPYCSQTQEPEDILPETLEEEEEEESRLKEREEFSDHSTPSPKPKLRPRPSLPTSTDDMILINQPNPISHAHPQSPFRRSPKSVPSSPFRVQVSTKSRSSHATPFQSPSFRHIGNTKRASSRDDLIQIMNQQLNTNDSSSSDSESDDDNEQVSSSNESEVDSDLEDTVTLKSSSQMCTSGTSPVKIGNVKQKVAVFLQTDLDEALGLRASVSTDSDLVADQKSDTIPPRPPLPDNLDDVPSSLIPNGVEVVHNVKPSQFIKKRGTPKRRNQSFGQDVNDAAKNLSDSGISNCHSQTFEDGFSALTTNQHIINSESEC